MSRPPEVGDILETGLIPCVKCGQVHYRHVLEVVDGKIEKYTWEKNGHAYHQMEEREYIERLHATQRDLQKMILKLARRNKTLERKLKA